MLTKLFWYSKNSLFFVFKGGLSIEYNSELYQPHTNKLIDDSEFLKEDYLESGLKYNLIIWCLVLVCLGILHFRVALDGTIYGFWSTINKYICGLCSDMVRIGEGCKNEISHVLSIFLVFSWWIYEEKWKTDVAICQLDLVMSEMFT
jgi:hypothetical protein